MIVRLPRKTEKRLDALAKRTGRTKSFYVRQALEENFDDMEDAALADRIWEAIQAGAPVYSHDEVKSQDDRPATPSLDLTPLTARLKSP